MLTQLVSTDLLLQDTNEKNEKDIYDLLAIRGGKQCEFSCPGLAFSPITSFWCLVAGPVVKFKAQGSGCRDIQTTGHYRKALFSPKMQAL